MSVFDDDAVNRCSFVGLLGELLVLQCVRLFARQSSTMERQSAARSLVFDDGTVIRCSLVRFEWCVLDGLKSGVIPFGFEWCALDGQESGVVPFGGEMIVGWSGNLLLVRWSSIMAR